MSGLRGTSCREWRRSSASFSVREHPRPLNPFFRKKITSSVTAVDMRLITKGVYVPPCCVHSGVSSALT